jgi:hypothetical protein
VHQIFHDCLSGFRGDWKPGGSMIIHTFSFSNTPSSEGSRLTGKGKVANVKGNNEILFGTSDMHGMIDSLLGQVFEIGMEEKSMVIEIHSQCHCHTTDLSCIFSCV